MLDNIRRRTHRSFVLTVIAAFLSLGVMSSASAGIVSAGKAVQAESTISHLKNVRIFLAREDVRANLEALGVDPARAQERVAAMSAEELATLSDRIDAVPAGGLLEVLGIILIVLLILEFLGVTNVFTKV